jgi:hypothetical protein
VLRSTFASLAREAPKALLARQLLSGAAEPGAWWSSQQAFSASAAAGSIVGWLLGLGDRHMDNLLLDRWVGVLTAAGSALETCLLCVQELTALPDCGHLGAGVLCLTLLSQGRHLTQLLSCACACRCVSCTRPAPPQGQL